MNRWRRYLLRLGDDREFVSGKYHVTLERLFFRSRVKVWRDIRPAVGGLIGARVMRDAEAERVYEEAVAVLTHPHNDESAPQG
jgi:hypothetical protein